MDVVPWPRTVEFFIGLKNETIECSFIHIYIYILKQVKTRLKIKLFHQ